MRQNAWASNVHDAATRNHDCSSKAPHQSGCAVLFIPRKNFATMRSAAEGRLFGAAQTASAPRIIALRPCWPAMQATARGRALILGISERKPPGSGIQSTGDQNMHSWRISIVGRLGLMWLWVLLP